MDENNNGTCRMVDELGRVVLPYEIRKDLGIECGDGLEISMDDDTIKLRKSSHCMDEERLKLIDARTIYFSVSHLSK